MNKIIVRIIMTLLAFMICLPGFCQDSAPQMADTMRSNGKIYVVVTVCLIILIGLFLYMIRVDRKVSKLEKEQR